MSFNAHPCKVYVCKFIHTAKMPTSSTRYKVTQRPKYTSPQISYAIPRLKVSQDYMSFVKSPLSLNYFTAGISHKVSCQTKRWIISLAVTFYFFFSFLKNLLDFSLERLDADWMRCCINLGIWPSSLKHKTEAPKTYGVVMSSLSTWPGRGKGGVRSNITFRDFLGKKLVT